MNELQPEKPVFAVACVLAVFSAVVSGSIYPFSAALFSTGAVICLFLSLSGDAQPVLARMWPAWALAGVAYLSGFWTVNLNLTLGQAFYLTGLAVFSYCVAFSSGGSRGGALLKVVFGVSVAVSAYGIYQYAFGFAKTEEYVRAYAASDLGLSETRAAGALAALEYRRAFSTMMSPNVLACYLAMALPAGVWSLKEARTAAGRAVVAAGLMCVMAVIPLTKSAGGLIATVVGLAVLVAAWSATGGPGRLRKAVALIVVIALLGVAAGYAVLSARTGGRWGLERSVGERINYFRGALDAFGEAPVAGNGAGSFPLTYLSRIKPGSGESRYAHNVVLQVMSETGVFGLAVLMLVFGVFTKRSVRGISSEPDGGVYPAVLAGGAAFLAHNMVDFTFYVHESAALFWLYFGIASTLPAGQAGKDRSGWRKTAYNSAVEGIALVLVLAYCFFYGKAVLADTKTADAQELLRENKMANPSVYRSRPAPPEALKLAKEAVSLKPYDDTSLAFLAGLYEGEAYRGGPEYAVLAENAYKKASGLNPLYPYHQRDLGILYLRMGRTDDAKASFGSALRQYPSDPTLRKLLSDTEK